MEAYLILIIYNFVFFYKFYKNPYLLCTSEIASTYFPFWIWSKGRISLKSDIYYPYPACIPFLSNFYPFHILSSYLSQFLSLDNSFRLYSLGILIHYLLSSILSYKLFGLFGAITLTYAGYCIKPQTPSFVYTMCWIPGCFISGIFGGISLGMAILGGYWPILVYILPILIYKLGFMYTIVGVIIGLPQIIPFLWYWPKSIRSGEKVDRNFGRLPWWKLIDSVIPTNDVTPTNGVHYPEVEMYMGIAILFIWHISFWWIPIFLSSLLVVGILPAIQRIPTRALYLLTLSISMLSLQDHLSILILQSIILLRNSSIYPSFPFSQWWNKPSELYHKYAQNVWPNFTGYLQNKHVKWYEGGFSLK